MIFCYLSFVIGHWSCIQELSFRQGGFRVPITMNRLIYTSKVFLSVYYANMIEYRAELFFWILSNSLPLILMGVWMQASQGGEFELTPEEFMRYFLSVFIVRQFTVVWMIFERSAGVFACSVWSGLGSMGAYLSNSYAEKLKE